MKTINCRLAVLLTCGVIMAGVGARAQGLPPDYSSNVLETISFGGASTNFEDALKDDFGYPPLSWTNLTTVPGDGTAVLMDTNLSLLQYPIVVEGGSWTNFTLQQGTVMMWVFLTNSSSGVWSLDANQYGAFIEAGSYTPDASYGWWSLRTDGSNILFSAQDNHGGQTNYLCAPINWSVASNQWMHLALTYAPDTNGTKFYINGALATNGPPMSVVPDTTVISNSFYLGSSGPSNLLHAAIDDIYFWNCPLDAATINDFFQSGYANFFLNPNTIGWVPGEVIPSAPFYTTNTSRAIAGAGFLQYVGAAPNWTSSGQVWMTNITATAGASGTTIYFTVMGGSNGLAYDTYATAALAGGGITTSVWSWMGQVYAAGRYALGGLPNTSAYIVLGTPTDQDADGLCDSYELLISHSSPTDPGSDLPQGWLWAYFGNFNHSATDLDSQGAYTLLYDYTYGLDPNVISFNISVTNQYVTARQIPVQVGVSAGVPASTALLVDSTNLAGANWVPYSSNMTAMTALIGANEGWHDIYMGMRGRPINSQQTWQGVRVKLDTTPPVLTITGPSNRNVSVSMIQLTGYSAEALSRLTYDISNATGILTDQLAVVTGQYYDTNTAEFTTNCFQAYDVGLTSGQNVISLHAVDLAGNLSTLTTNFIYSANTNAAVVSLVWPQDAMQVSGSNFTIKGQVDDPTATVSVTITDTNGNSTVLPGRTGRDGIFWIENVPLVSGTNSLTLTLSRPGVDTTTNFTLIQSGVGLTINTVQAGDTMVGGSMDTAGYTIWVNGGCATNNGDGTWTAQITPIGIGGGLVLVTAIPNTDSGGNGTGGGAGVNPYSAQAINTQATVQPPQGVYISAYHYSTKTDCIGYFGPGPGLTHLDCYDILDWQDGRGGNQQEFYYADWQYWTPMLRNRIWPTNNWPQALADGTENVGGSSAYTNVIGPPALVMEHCDINQTIDRYGSRERRTADTEVMLATGGPLGSTEKNLWIISASLTAYSNETDTVGVPVPPEEITIGELGNLDTNGYLCVVLSDNDPRNADPKTAKALARGTVTVAKSGFLSLCEAMTPYDRARTNLGVGEQVKVYFTPKPTEPPVMTFTGGGSLVASSTNPIPAYYMFTAPSNAATVTITASFRLGGKTHSKTFNVVEPSGYEPSMTFVVGTIPYLQGKVAAQAHFLVTIAPTNVSFGKIQVMEVGLPATNASGWFTNEIAWTTNDISHVKHGADEWVPVLADNSWSPWVAGDGGRDFAGLAMLGSYWFPGGYDWNIPARWKVGNNGPTNTMPGWVQSMLVDYNGITTINKFGWTVSRTPNGNYDFHR